ncbi:calcium homeostasis modulator protein 6-like [Saccoglossus kowalevskii]|uniref:Protein FAM26F-like n=1 Tax=Saccoglossus kowalevskii TaxID=10224 RepID=A0ABM0MS54_SACKO|nr:PREDICTED: protein FAM26F-like [Saccoglossus kowalevskii]
MIIGIIFISAPAVIIFCLGILAQSSTWRVVTGCYTMTSHISGGECHSRILVVIGQSLLGPLVWLFVAFMNGDYYACINSSTNCDVDEDPSIVEFSDKDKAQSQIIAWLLLAVISILVLFCYCILRCCNRYSYEQQQYYKEYVEAEEDEFNEQCKEAAKIEAKTTVSKFYEQKNIKGQPIIHHGDWKEIKTTWEAITVLGSGFAGKEGYTPLYYWAKCSEDRCERQDTVVINVINEQNKDGVKEVSEHAAPNTAVDETWSESDEDILPGSLSSCH